MNKTISILGCGWLGKALAIELIKKDFKINGSTTSQNKLALLELNKINPFLIDLNNKNNDIATFLLSDVLVIAIPPKNIECFENLIPQIEKSGIRKILFISSTSVYPNTNGIVTEATQTKNTRLSGIEKLFKLNINFKLTIIRFGGLFGYHRQPGNFFKPGSILNNPQGFVNLIHRNDCIKIIEQIIVKDTWDQTLNACSDSHPMRKEFYLNEFKKLGKSNLLFEEESKNEFKIVSSQKLKTLLDYKFEFNNLLDY